MYAHFQDATLIPVQVDAGTYSSGSVTVPPVDAIAAKAAAENLWLAAVNLDRTQPVRIHAAFANNPVRYKQY